MENLNQSSVNKTFNESWSSDYRFMSEISVQVIFGFLYLAIFVVGVSGNFLVCYIVFKDKPMQTVTNIFISNLALADILLCLLCVPFTPMYYFLEEWVFGPALCQLLPFSQGCAVYISTLTLMAIAVDRYFVIIHPFRERMKITTSLMIIIGIWGFAILATLPYGYFTGLIRHNYFFLCVEQWPSESSRYIYGISTVIMQFIIPFIIISYCYVRVSLKLQDRARSKPGCKSSKKEEIECKRKRRTNRMLIAMVAIFGFSWLPLNVINLTEDVHMWVARWQFYDFFFFVAHIIAMSSTCYNPFLYSWLNKNFRKQFRKILPCFKYKSNQSIHRRLSTNEMETTCNGNDNTMEMTMPSQIYTKDELRINEAEVVTYNVQNDEIHIGAVVPLLGDD